MQDTSVINDSILPKEILSDLMKQYIKSQNFFPLK